MRQSSASGTACIWMRRHYAGEFTIKQAAGEVGMSASAYHQHFKAVTSLSPVQVRNHLRLQEGRRLMVAGGLDAAAAGFQVGYESPSQFSRDYARTFGVPLRATRRVCARCKATPWWRRQVPRQFEAASCACHACRAAA